MTIYDNIRRLGNLATTSGIAHEVEEVRSRIVSRADAALEIVAIHGTFGDILEEIKVEADRIAREIVKLNNLLTAVIKEEAERMLGSAG